MRARAKAASIKAHLRAGWKYVEGLLEKAGIKKRPSEMLPNKSGQPDFNPRLDAVCLRIFPDAVFVSDNRYSVWGGKAMVDRNGMFRDPDECLECGSVDGEYKWRVPVEQFDQRTKRRYWAWTYCRRCVSPADLEENRRRVAAAPPPRRR